MPVIAPAHHGGHRRQDGLDPGGGLQAEERAAVLEQIELDVPSPAIELEVAFAVSEGMVLPFLENGHIGF